MAELRRLWSPQQKKRQRAGQLKAGEKPAGKWQATVRHPSLKRYSRSFYLKDEARDWAAEEERKIRRGEWVDPNAGKVTLEAWRGKWLETRRVEVATEVRVESQWRTHIEPVFGAWPLSSIQSWDVEAWVTDMEARAVGAATVNAALRQLGHMLRAAVKHKLLLSDPTGGVKATPPQPHVDRVLTRDEAKRLLEQFGDDDRLFVELLLYCGLRTQEAIGLRRFRVDLLRKRINIVKVLPRRGGEKAPKTPAGVRPVPLTDELVVKLSRIIPEPNDELVFTSKPKQGSPGGKRIRYEHWHTDVWTPALRRAGLADPQPTPHDLRHTFGSWLGEAGVPPKQIAALMGHKSLRSVERYIHATEARFDQARAALERQRQPPQAHSGVPK
jgi:integrase